jgi:radical SAM superfamily enzyme YgiQ (UPF0313 family)
LEYDIKPGEYVSIEVFQQTLDMLDALEVDVIQVSVFTPLPGTPRFHAMKSRILDRDWAHYDFHNVVFQPRKMSRADLQAAHDWVTREFYSPHRIVKRILRHLRRPGGLGTLPYHIALNLAYFGRVFRWKIRGHNPAGTRGTVPRTFGSMGPAVVSRCPETIVQR